MDRLAGLRVGGREPAQGSYLAGLVARARSAVAGVANAVRKDPPKS